MYWQTTLFSLVILCSSCFPFSQHRSFRSKLALFQNTVLVSSQRHGSLVTWLTPLTLAVLDVTIQREHSYHCGVATTPFYVSDQNTRVARQYAYTNRSTDFIQDDTRSIERVFWFQGAVKDTCRNMVWRGQGIDQSDRRYTCKKGFLWGIYAGIHQGCQVK